MPERPLVENTIPILRVRDIHASLDYYLNRLGFTQEWLVDDGDASMAGISRDGRSIYLTQAEQGQPGTWVWMGVQDARAFYAEYQTSGAMIRQEPTNFPWALEFRVADLDGNVLRIGSEPE